ncbi:MAG: hypothetical protein R3Y09_08175 [Clostridia bacterium]
MLYTTNYNMNKPQITDVVDIEKISSNFDIIDTTMASNNVKIQNIPQENLIIDSGFQVWLDGTSVINTANSKYTATMWWNYSPTCTVAQSSYSGFGKTLKYTATGSHSVRLCQKQDNDFLDLLVGKNLACSFWIRSIKSDNLTLYAELGVNSTLVSGSKTISGLTTTWRKVSFVMNYKHNETYSYDGLFSIYSGTIASGQGFEIAQVKVEYGDVATPYIGETYAKAYSDVLPYFEQSWVGSWTAGQENLDDREITSLEENHKIRFALPKRIVPTISTYSPLDKAEEMQYYTAPLGGTSLADINVKLTVVNITKNSFETKMSERTNGYSNRTYHWRADARLY